MEKIIVTNGKNIFPNITKGNRILRYGCRTFDAFWGFQIFPFGPPHETMKIKVVQMTLNFERFQENPKTSRF